MPLYDYRCKSCKYEFEEIAKICERYNVKCPSCSGEVDIMINPKGKTLKFFPAGIWEDIGPEPLVINNRRELKEACEKHGCYAKYLDGYSGY